jgi:mevalonate kinase
MPYGKMELILTIILKLCGSGGGGYILGFTEDLERAKLSLKDYKLEVVYQF